METANQRLRYWLWSLVPIALLVGYYLYLSNEWGGVSRPELTEEYRTTAHQDTLRRIEYERVHDTLMVRITEVKVVEARAKKLAAPLLGLDATDTLPLEAELWAADTGGQAGHARAR